jgi:hypothetical protein
MCLYEGFPVEEDKFGGVRKYCGKEETRALQKGSNRDWRKLYSETLINLYSLQNIKGVIIQKNEIDESHSTYGRKQKCILGLVKKPEEKRQLEKELL